MSDTLTPRTQIDNWQVLGVDGRRAQRACQCGAVRVIAVDALRTGTCAPNCGCAALTSEQVALRRGETERQRRQRTAGARRPKLPDS
jgi:hypothetical protein